MWRFDIWGFAMIEVKILNPESLIDAEKAMLAAARLTQRGHKISDMNDFLELYNRPINKNLIRKFCELPHVTLQKFGAINVMVTGLSRRALAQLTRHQNEVKFMAGSLQYSTYSNASYIIPEELTFSQKKKVEALYKDISKLYNELIEEGAGPDAAGYIMPQGFRTSLLISATPYQLKHMIGQRTCRRNTPEVRYIMIEIWKALMGIAPELFEDAGPSCMRGACAEGYMSCGEPIKELTNENKNY